MAERGPWRALRNRTCGCGRSFRPAAPNHIYCSAACKPRRSIWNRRPITRTCPIDGVEFTTRYLRQAYCSDLCRNRATKRRLYDAGSRRHFPRIRGHARLQVLERDGWRCGICGGVIDPTLRWPHPGSASIDHRDPNGAHEPANWQASHLGCNVEKGARVA